MPPRIAFLIALLAVLPLAGCNTMEGLGQDVEAAGETIEDTAQDVEGEVTD